MARILKYPLECHAEQKVKTCAGQVLAIQFQYGTPMVWVLVEDETKIVERIIRMIGTGITFTPDGSQYLTTLLLDGGGLALHVFVEEGKSFVEN